MLFFDPLTFLRHSDRSWIGKLSVMVAEYMHHHSISGSKQSPQICTSESQGTELISVKACSIVSLVIDQLILDVEVLVSLPVRMVAGHLDLGDVHRVDRSTGSSRIRRQHRAHIAILLSIFITAVLRRFPTVGSATMVRQHPLCTFVVNLTLLT